MCVAVLDVSEKLFASLWKPGILTSSYFYLDIDVEKLKKAFFSATACTHEELGDALAFVSCSLFFSQ